MSAGRQSRPLFDLLDGTSSKPRAGLPRIQIPASPSHVEIKPRPARPAPTPSDSSPRIGLVDRVRSRVKPFLGDATLTVPANAVYYAAALVVLILVAAWIIGFRLGDARARRELAPFTKAEPLRIDEPQQPVREATPQRPSTPSKGPAPSGSSAGTTPGLSPVVPTPDPRAVIPVRRDEAPTIEASSNNQGPESVLTAQGWVGADPREVNLNYLFLGMVNRAEAERVVKFCNDNGLEVLALPVKVDGRGKSGNNPPPADAVYRLAVRRGLTGEEIRDEAPIKVTIQNGATRLGQLWKREQRGTLDFSRYSWEKLVERR